MNRNTRSAMARRSALRDISSPDNKQKAPAKSVIPKQKENLKTKVTLTKSKVRALKTSSFRETFPGRLDWKRRHFDKPVTSTPTATVKLKPVFSTFSNKDVQNCFGFENSEDSDQEENYSHLISPIPKEPISTFQKQTTDQVLLNALPKKNILALDIERITDNIQVPISPIPKETTNLDTEKGKNTTYKVLRSSFSKTYGNSATQKGNKVDDQTIISPIPTRSSKLTAQKGKNTAKDRVLRSFLRKDNTESDTQKSKVGEQTPLPKPKKKAISIPTRRIVKKRKKEKEQSPVPEQNSSSILVDEVNEQYLCLKPSDIGDPGVEVKDFNDLLERYNFEDNEDEIQMHPRRAVATYPAKRSSDEPQPKKSRPKIVKPKKQSKKSTKTKKIKPTGSHQFGKKNEYEEIDEATKEWLEKKNKEFQEILKVKLIVERSFTQE